MIIVRIDIVLLYIDNESIKCYVFGLI